MRFLQRISQAFFLVLFIYFFFRAAYPLTSRVPVDFFLRSDPLIVFSAALSARSPAVITIPALVMFVVALIFGRVFCGWVCPLGTVIDYTGTRTGGRTGTIFRLKWLKYGVLFFIGITALVSVQAVGWFDPIALLTRTMTVFIYPIFVLALEGLFSLLMHVPLLAEPVFNADNALRGVVLPVHELRFSAAVAVAVICISILCAGAVKRRFWCRYLCPLGALYALGAGLRIHRRRVSRDCTACGACIRHCRMGAIAADGRTTDHGECITCMDCVAVCPENAVSFGFGKTGGKQKYDLSRRRFITAGAAGLVTAGLARTALTNPRDRGAVIRPPGALAEPDFLDRCIRCGECVKVCSSSGGGLQYAAFQSGFAGVWSPLIVSETGYCELNCVMCGEVCPTGAIRVLELEERMTLKMGTANFNRSRCIPWYSGVTCTVCEEHCPLPEKAIRFRKSIREDETGKRIIVQLPYVDETRCVGCGICVYKCPLEGERGIFLTNANETRW